MKLLLYLQIKSVPISVFIGLINIPAGLPLSITELSDFKHVQRVWNSERGKQIVQMDLIHAHFWLVANVAAG